MDPWGTPLFTNSHLEQPFLNTTLGLRLLRNAIIHDRTLPIIQYDFSLIISRLWGWCRKLWQNLSIWCRFGSLCCSSGSSHSRIPAAVWYRSTGFRNHVGGKRWSPFSWQGPVDDGRLCVLGVWRLGWSEIRGDSYLTWNDCSFCGLVIYWHLFSLWGSCWSVLIGWKVFRREGRDLGSFWRRSHWWHPVPRLYWPWV